MINSIMTSRPIQIRRPDVVENARALAELTKTSITDAVADAVKTRLETERIRANSILSKRREAVIAALDELRQLPKVGPGLSDADLYDEEGFPK